MAAVSTPTYATTQQTAKKKRRRRLGGKPELGQQVKGTKRTAAQQESGRMHQDARPDVLSVPVKDRSQPRGPVHRVGEEAGRWQALVPWLQHADSGTRLQKLARVEDAAKGPVGRSAETNG
jgi:hypothetical protein